MGSRFMGYHLRDKDLDSPLGYSYVLSILPTSILIKLVVLMIAFCILLVFIGHVLLLEFLDFLRWRNLETLKFCPSGVKLQIRSQIAWRVSKTRISWNSMISPYQKTVTPHVEDLKTLTKEKKFSNAHRTTSNYSSEIPNTLDSHQEL